MSAPTGSALGRLLLVDDDQRLCERLARALERRGFEVCAVGDYGSALGAARAAPFDFAVLDLRVPGGTGLELLSELRRLHEPLRAVLLTGYGSIAGAVDTLRLGALDYLTKPADADQIVSALGVRDRAPGDAEASVAPEPETPSLARAEWEHIQRVLSDVDGNISEAARRLGLHRRSLQRKLSKFAPD